MSDPHNAGFLRRWSARKNDARQGKTLTPEPPASTPTPSPLSASASAAPAVEVPTADNAEPSFPAPTLDDVGQLTPASDFSAFVRHEVPVDVKNAAMKKLFADPHFNVMDGLDVYIDDYSQPDPLAPAVLRQMASAQFLKLVEEPKESILDPHHDHADLRLQPDPAARPQDSGPEPG